MKSVLVTTAIALLVVAGHAAPVPVVEARQSMVQITFQGATPSAQFAMAMPMDGTMMKISMSSVLGLADLYPTYNSVVYLLDVSMLLTLCQLSTFSFRLNYHHGPSP